MFNSTINLRANDLSIYSVSTLNLAIRDQLEGSFFYCLVDGEVSNAAFPQSGHIYFNLKDDGAVIKAVIWRSQAALYRGLIASGQKVRVTGKITVYAPRGEYQLIVSRVEEAGKGDLHLQFEALKKKLEAEGMFDVAFKKPVPKHPLKIGIVTSPTAAALQDVLNVFSAHRPDIPLKLYETKVQGESAKQEIANAIHNANQEKECDLLLLIRGGGSIEDLWAFNEEIVARAIFASDIPIITGIGHETDTTIADFVADLRAPTPSIAAKYSSQSRDELFQLLNEFEVKMTSLMWLKYENSQKNLLKLRHRLEVKEPKLQILQFSGELNSLTGKLREILVLKVAHANFALRELQGRLDKKLVQEALDLRQKEFKELSNRMDVSILKRQQEIKQRFMSQVEKLQVLSPLTTLLRGYSMTTDQDGKVVKSITQVAAGNQLNVQVADGSIAVQVSEIKLL